MIKPSIYLTIFGFFLIKLMKAFVNLHCWLVNELHTLVFILEEAFKILKAPYQLSDFTQLLFAS